jgi:hypothetical protein
MAVVGKNFAILESGRLRMSGFVTWLVWVFLHLMSLPQLQNRLRVQTEWFWSYFTGQRSSRLIPETREHGHDGWRVLGRRLSIDRSPDVHAIGSDVGVICVKCGYQS